MNKIKNLKWAALIMAAFTLSSCEELAFRQPMPHNSPNLAAFPDECIGTFVAESDSKDTLVVYGDSVKDDRFSLNADNLIRRHGKYYILNQHKKDRWTVAAIKPRGKKGFDLYWFNMEGEKNRESVSKVTNVVNVQDPDTGHDYYLIDPNEKEFQKLLKSRAFQRKERFRRI